MKKVIISYSIAACMLLNSFVCGLVHICHPCAAHPAFYTVDTAMITASLFFLGIACLAFLFAIMFDNIK